jgi:hypothetical protein
MYIHCTVYDYLQEGQAIKQAITKMNVTKDGWKYTLFGTLVSHSRATHGANKQVLASSSG